MDAEKIDGWRQQARDRVMAHFNRVGQATISDLVRDLPMSRPLVQTIVLAQVRSGALERRKLKANWYIYRKAVK